MQFLGGYFKALTVAIFNYLQTLVSDIRPHISVRTKVCIIEWTLPKKPLDWFKQRCI